jgi:chitodextrinase
MKYLLIFLSSFIVFVANADPLPKDVNATITNTPDVNVLTMPAVDVTLPETMNTNIVNTPGVNVINTPTVVIGNDDNSPIPVTLDSVDDSQPKINLIVADPNEAHAHQYIIFYPSVSGGDAPLEYLWEFGDGDTYTGGIDADKFYDNPGVYVVTLTVIDADGDVDSYAVSVKVGEEDTQPNIDYITLTVPAMAGDAIDFVPILTAYDHPISFYWEFGDGTTSSLQSTSHTYLQPGHYNATLLVTDSDGDTASETILVQIDPKP